VLLGLPAVMVMWKAVARCRGGRGDDAGAAAAREGDGGGRDPLAGRGRARAGTATELDSDVEDEEGGDDGGDVRRAAPVY
jgi:hypothetical protein